VSDILSKKDVLLAAEKHDSLYASTLGQSNGRAFTRGAFWAIEIMKDMDHHGVVEIIATALEKEKARSAKLIEALEFYAIRDRCFRPEISPAKQALAEYAKGEE